GFQDSAGPPTGPILSQSSQAANDPNAVSGDAEQTTNTGPHLGNSPAQWTSAAEPAGTPVLNPVNNTTAEERRHNKSESANQPRVPERTCAPGATGSDAVRGERHV
ncbi:MAG: hypothetical protein WCI74_19905, partial [Actinomycetes bacterium]